MELQLGTPVYINDGPHWGIVQQLYKEGLVVKISGMNLLLRYNDISIPVEVPQNAPSMFKEKKLR
jgi:hypothetical protein